MIDIILDNISNTRRFAGDIGDRAGFDPKVAHLGACANYSHDHIYATGHD